MAFEIIQAFTVYGIYSLVFGLLIYPFSRKWSRNTTRFIVDIQLSSAMTTSSEHLVQTQGNQIIPIAEKRRPFFILIMFNLFIVSLVLGVLPENTMVECRDGTVINSALVNDGINHCPDSSDEYIDPVLEIPVGEPLQEKTVDFVSNIHYVLGGWGVLLALCGPIFLLFLNTRLVYEYCPVLILDSKQQSITRFGDRKNRRIGPMIGSGAILITLQLIVREGWGQASFTEMGIVLLYILTVTIAISIGQLITLMFSIRRIRHEANELALILLGFRLARPVTMHWKSSDRAFRQRLLEYNKMPSQAVVLDQQLLEKYDLVERYIEQRKIIDELKSKGETAAELMGFT